MEAERVIARLVSAELAMRDWKDKAYRLRRVVAGDKSALFDKSTGSNSDVGQQQHISRKYRDNRPDILIQEFSEGTNNEILKAIMVLVEQTCYSFPKIEIQGLTAKEQAANNHYLAQTLKNCHAVDHGKIALLDYLMGGTGDLYTPMENGAPIVRWADSLDLKFDPTARLVCDVRWKSITVCEPLYIWLDRFAKQRGKFELMLGPIEDEMLDRPFELEFYYDTYEKGGYMVLAKTSDTGYFPEPIYEGANPHYMDYNGKKEPYLPFQSLFYMMLPSVRSPIGAAEKALPDQIGAWRSMESIKRATDKGSPFYEYTADAFKDEEAEEEWKKGGDAKVGEVGHLKQQPAMQMDAKVAEMLTMHTQGIQTQLGANNYSLGAPVQGVKYAREVNAMQSAGSLTAGAISKANARCWEGLCQNVLCAGAHFDKRNFSCWIEGVQMKFGKSEPLGPIAQYLRPEAELVIAEDSMRFMPQADRIQQASAILDRAMQLARLFPSAVELAARRFYQANGIENVDDWVKQPPPPDPTQMMPGQQPPGGAPGMDGTQQLQQALPGQQVAVQNGTNGGALPS